MNGFFYTQTGNRLIYEQKAMSSTFFKIGDQIFHSYNIFLQRNRNPFGQSLSALIFSILILICSSYAKAISHILLSASEHKKVTQIDMQRQ